MHCKNDTSLFTIVLTSSRLFNVCSILLAISLMLGVVDTDDPDDDADDNVLCHICLLVSSIFLHLYHVMFLHFEYLSLTYDSHLHELTSGVWAHCWRYQTLNCIFYIWSQIWRSTPGIAVLPGAILRYWRMGGPQCPRFLLGFSFPKVPLMWFSHLTGESVVP